MNGVSRRVAAALAIHLSLAAPFDASGQSGDDLTRLSDEFNHGDRLAGWRLHHETEGWTNKFKVLDVDQSTRGSLYLEPWSSVWYLDYTVPFLYKPVEGDFKVTARVRGRGTRTPYPQTLYSGR